MADHIKTNHENYELAVKLLGRKPRTPFTIKTFCPSGSPQVLLADPVFLEENIWKPFPTLLWLTCPRLKLLVGNLEQQGLVRDYSQRLSDDENFKKLFLEEQKEIAEIRIKMADELYPGELPQHIRKILSETTIAGSKDIYGVKCLHSHLAQHLAFNNNPIGAEILIKIGVCENHHNCGNEITSIEGKN